MKPARSAPDLRIVGAPSRRRELTAEELAERQRRRDHWAKVHIAGDHAPPLNLASRSRGLFRLGGGPRRERGGYKFEERC